VAASEEHDVKHKDNVSGRYWVSCTYCCRFGICVETAPNNFRFPAQPYQDDYYRNGAYVFKQPDTQKEEEQCRLAIQFCPVDVIHDDG
jgi:ferredoxin